VIDSPAGVLVDPAQIRRHAGNLRAFQDRFDAIHAASSSITQDDGAFGMLCSWLPAVLATRHRRQEELTHYVAENLLLLASGLHSVAAGYESTDSKSASTIRNAGGLT
jgi:hypothetical protein